MLLIRELMRAGSDFEPVVVVAENGPLARFLADRAIPCEPIDVRYRWDQPTNVFGRARAAVSPALRLAAVLRRQRCLMVHTNDARMHVLWAAPARLAGAAHVWHQRSRYAPSRLSDLALRAARSVVCISRFAASTMPAPVAGRTTVVDNPFLPAAVDRMAARAAMLAACDAPPGAAVVAFVANLTLQKRPSLFLAAAQLLVGMLGRPVVFPILGADRDGLESDLRHQATAAGIGDRVRFLGFREPVEQWLAGADLLLAPAVEDAFGRTLVEAIHVGTPVVAARSGGHTEILAHGQTGILVPPDDARALAGAAYRVLTELDLRERLTATARAEVLPRYTLARHVAAIASIYRQLSPA